MNHESFPSHRHRIADVSICIGCSAIVSLVAGLALHTISAAANPPPFPVTISSGVSNLTAAIPQSASLSTPAQTVARGSVNLKWDASKDLSVAGYRVYYGTNAGNYFKSLVVGLKTNATVNGLMEGTKYFFAVVAHDAIGVESPYSNEVSATTGFYIYLEEYVWNAKEWGVIGKTNQVQISTNLSNWTPILTWVGNGKLTNVLHTNVVQSYFRGVVK